MPKPLLSAGPCFCLSLSLLAGASHAQERFIAYEVPAPSTGNYSWRDPLGLDFDVNSPIRVTRVGAFDNDQNGLLEPITLYLYDRNSQQALIGALTVFGTEGEVVGGNRLVDVPDVTLPVGNYTVVAENYGGSEPYYDQGATPSSQPAVSTENSGNGLISFVGLGRFAGDGNGNARGQYPTIIDA